MGRMVRTVANPANPPAALPQANDLCWCGSGRKYKRCHRKIEGRVLPGEVSPMREVPAEIGRPPYAETGDVVPWDELADQVARRDRADAPRRIGRGRDPAARRRGRAARRHDRRDRRLRPRPLRRAGRLSEPAELPRVPEEPVHVGQRGHLPRHPRLAGAARRRHRQPRRHGVHRRRARRHQRDVLRRRRRSESAAASPRSPRSACGTASRRSCPAGR